MAGKLFVHLRRQWIGVLALLLVLTGGTAYALDGSNTVFNDDIVNGQVKTDDIGNAEVKVADIAQGAVATDELGNNQIKAADIGDGQVTAGKLAANSVDGAKIIDGQVKSPEIGNGQVQAQDLAAGVAPGASGARAYASVDAFDCTGTPGTCDLEQSKGVTNVTRDAVGDYCITVPGINANGTPAVVSVDWNTTSPPEGNAIAFTNESGCGPNRENFRVFTYWGDNVAVVDSGGTPRTVAGASDSSNFVGFTIVIP